MRLSAFALPVVASLTALSLLGSSALGSLHAAEQTQQKEKQIVDGTNVGLTNKAELLFKKVRDDEQVKTRELWYQRFDGAQWGAWEKHPLEFSRTTPITWAPPEGHWRTYFRIIEISGFAHPQPTADSKHRNEFIVDRTQPTVVLNNPPVGTILSTNQTYVITWNVTDDNLHSKPVNLYWARSSTAEPEIIATGLPNSGEYTWTTPADMSNEGRIIIEAYDKVLNKADNEHGNIIVDGAAPHGNILGPDTTQTRDVAIQTRVKDAGPAAAVHSSQLFFSTDEGQNWSEGPVVNAGPDENFESVMWQAPNDGEYMLSILAIDIVGNANPRPASKRDNLHRILVDTAAPAISLSSDSGVLATDGSGKNIFNKNDVVAINFSVEDMRLSDSSINIYYQSGPDTWEQITQGLATGTTTYSWSIPEINSTQCRIKIQATDVAGNVGETISKQTFSIDNDVADAGGDVDL